MTRRRLGDLLLVTSLVLPLSAGCVKPRPGVNAAALGDAEVSARVKTALLNDAEIGTARIDVDTRGGVVTLSGRVASKEQEARAVALARAARGVTSVSSTLQIQP